ncbi:hypothetical protein WJ78_11365 [Burkholderia ubonensis]|nr:hypothetical protein WJ31_11265 [Burkholderia ubonensis]KVO69422.1 hypothetical protein WJ78_11365 [Burkholderia ubonensis]KVP88086.1 hypothetical protein WJ97_28500 [Burkholderia ubonensis]KWC56753.1 hypothetical protein WL54_23495 [Burkholderia ubonensis]KWO86220.1 hypothetical protein WM31_21995 [Burkholderia ubonensis]
MKALLALCKEISCGLDVVAKMEGVISKFSERVRVLLHHLAQCINFRNELSKTCWAIFLNQDAYPKFLEALAGCAEKS